MNCNPFTLGHRYLIEQACAQVDVLYVFVVEEDASLFPFEDRMALVKACTKDLEKVRVLPSGRFMISKDTFRDYFEKAQLQEAEIDASMDIDLFGRYVAPYFHITKRFAGEEPFDRVTCQYNEQMRRRLADYGVEFIEIPRKKAGTDIISATTVRKLAGAREWEKLSSLLPGETYEYLKNNIARIEHMQSIVRQEPDDGEVYAEIVERICACDRVVIYALGSEGERILKKVPERELGKLVLCNKRAETQSLYWKGKRVISPSEFLDEYKEYDVIVTPSPRTYGCEVYMFLREHGVDKERILCNRRLAGL